MGFIFFSFVFWYLCKCLSLLVNFRVLKSQKCVSYDTYVSKVPRTLPCSHFTCLQILVHHVADCIISAKLQCH